MVGFYGIQAFKETIPFKPSTILAEFFEDFLKNAVQYDGYFFEKLNYFNLMKIYIKNFLEIGFIML